MVNQGDLMPMLRPQRGQFKYEPTWRICSTPRRSGAGADSCVSRAYTDLMLEPEKLPHRGSKRESKFYSYDEALFRLQLQRPSAVRSVSGNLTVHS